MGINAEAELRIFSRAGQVPIFCPNPYAGVETDMPQGIRLRTRQASADWNIENVGVVPWIQNRWFFRLVVISR